MFEAAVNFWASFILVLCFLQHYNALRKDCFQALGMRSGTIKNSQLDAKSHDTRWGPERGRLYNDRAWCSNIERRWEDYLQIDLQRVRHVSAIATQGTKWLLTEYYVKSYAIKYSFDESTWYTYKQNIVGKYQVKEFTGNSNVDGVKRNEFNDEFVTRFLRIYPLTYQNDMCLRVEVYGCEDSKDDCSKFIDQSTGEITTPKHPNPYPGGLDCTWIITGSLWQRVALLFKHFDVGNKAGIPGSCSGDFLKVRDGPHDWSTLLGLYCDGHHPTLVKSTEEVIRIQFHSTHNSNTRTGFQLQFMKFTSGNDEVFSRTACDGAILQLDCSEFSKAIHVLHTFFGVYPFARDCAELYSTTSCYTSGATENVMYHCQDHKQCSLLVQQSSFGNGTCANAVTQRLEVYYQCTSTNLKTASPVFMTTTVAPALSSGTPALGTILTPAHVTPAPFTNKSTSSSATTPATTPSVRSSSSTPAWSDGTAEETTTQATTSKGTGVIADKGATDARTGGSMATGSLVAVVVVAVLVVIGVFLAVMLYVVYRRRLRTKETPVPSVMYCRQSFREASHNKKRCNTDPDERKYDSVNILYESADSEKPNQLQVEEHIYESAGGRMTDNPLYVRSTPDQDDGYETVRPPTHPAAIAPHLYERSVDPKRVDIISNPNYEKTLEVKTLSEDT